MLTTEMTSGPTVASYTRLAMRRWSDRTALVGGGIRWTYAELSAQTNRIARFFREIGLKRGDAIALLSGNSPHVVAITQAVQLIGARYTPLHPMGSEDDHVFVLDDAEISTLIVDPALYEGRGRALAGRAKLDRMLALGPTDFATDLIAGAATQDAGDAEIDARPEDICNLGYTGGTTGKPKGVVHRHRSVVNMLTQELAYWEWPKEVRFLVATPLSHAAGAMLTPTMVQGGTFFFHQGFDAGAFLETVQRERITAAFVVPTMLYALLDHPNIADYDLSSLEMLIYGAAPASPSRIAEAIARFGPVLCQLYGQSEAPQTICYFGKADHDPAKLERLGSCGMPIPANQVRLLKDDGSEAGPGEPGEICFRGPTIMEEYWKRPEETAAAFKDGWLHTGDVARYDDEGYLYIVDRSKDMIVTGGFNVFPREIEDCLAQHPAVAMSVVIGAPDEKWGEAVRAVVVLKPGAEAAPGDLIAMVRDAKGAVYAPKYLEFAETLPHTAVGKLDRKAVRAAYWGDRARMV